MREKRGALSGEERLIDRLFRPIAKHPGAFGLMDDAAAITPPAGHDLVLTVDAIVSGVHFFPDDPAEAVAKKALRVNLSDLAAKGAAPIGALLSLSMPENTSDAWLESFANGLGEDCDSFACPLLGGDMTRTPGALTISITALGSVPLGRMVRRKGARAGDVIVASGTIGDAALGLRMRRSPDDPALAQLDGAAKEHLRDRYLLPRPRLGLAAALRDHASAAMDVSDGLAGDMAKLAAASGVHASIDAALVPLSAGARAALGGDEGLIEPILTGGDDYEIVAAVPADRLEAFRAAAVKVRIEVTTIGRIEAGNGIEVIGPNGQALDLKHASFSHF
jgi:thiamine-monophosphate kinase